MSQSWEGRAWSLQFKLGLADDLVDELKVQKWKLISIIRNVTFKQVVPHTIKNDNLMMVV